MKWMNDNNTPDGVSVKDPWECHVDYMCMMLCNMLMFVFQYSRSSVGGFRDTNTVLIHMMILL